VTEAGGFISAENVPGGGARLTIRLPAAAPAAPAVAPAEDARQSGPPSGGSPVAPAHPPAAAATQARVLVVDDEPAIRDIQRRFLAGVGVTATTAKDGVEAISLLEREHFDAVVTDLRMPGVDGIQLFEWIAARNPDLATRCLFVTGELWVEGEGVLARQGERVITKPFTREAYLARVLEVLEPGREAP
ncbi:MAG TPA: response regulator, partial [Gemmatimonadaceae bacterium]|nr:response regulator [Gemmatimonadaceae bacterium]